MLTAPIILTAWDTDGPVDDTEEEEERLAQRQSYWVTATDFRGRWGGGPHFAHCHVCDRDLERHSEVAAVVIMPHEEDDPDDPMRIRRVCRYCAPDEARARIIAATLVPDLMGGAA
jgi:hypothetical protein